MSSKKSATFTSNVIQLPGMPGMFGVEVPSKVIESVEGKFKARFVCTINGKLRFQCGLMPLGKGRGYIFLSKEKRKTLGLAEGSKVKASLVPDRSKYGLNMPVELKELLKQDKEGSKRFHALTPGKQRNIIYYVSAAKTENTRIERAFLLIGNLKKLPPGKEAMRDIFAKHDLGSDQPKRGGRSERMPGSISFDELFGRRKP